MDAVETLKQDVEEGRVKPERLIDLIGSLQQQLQTTQQQLQAAQEQLQAAHKRIEELEKKLGGPSPTKVDEAYSMRAEERRKKKEARKKRKQKGRGGRLKTKDKIALAERTEAVYPDGISPSECYLSHTRPVWRLENHRAVLIAYEIYRNSTGKYGGTDRKKRAKSDRQLRATWRVLFVSFVRAFVKMFPSLFPFLSGLDAGK